MVNTLVVFRLQLQHRNFGQMQHSNQVAQYYCSLDYGSTLDGLFHINASYRAPAC